MANMNLVTGYIGSNHVTAADAGSFNAAIFGNGQYLLSSGQKLSATVITNNHLRIYDGDLVMQGRHVRINEGDYVDLTIENGATDYNRNDLVVARYTKDASSGVEAVNLVVIKGTAVTGTAEDPAYTIGDIMNDGAVLNEMPIYRIKINGLNIADVTLLAEKAPNLQDMVNELLSIGRNAVSKISKAVSIPVSYWSGSGPYRVGLNVEGVTADNDVLAEPDYNSREHYYDCGVGMVEQAQGTLVFTAQDKPTETLLVNLLILT